MDMQSMALVVKLEYINCSTERTVLIIYSSSLFAYPQPAKYSEILVTPLKIKSTPHYQDSSSNAYDKSY